MLALDNLVAGANGANLVAALDKSKNATLARFFTSSDVEHEGPFRSLGQALELEDFSTVTAHAAGTIDALYSRGLLNTFQAVNVAARLEQAIGAAVLSAPCDAPDLPPDLYDRLSRQSGPACVVDLPLVGLWPCALAAHLRSWLDDGRDRSFRAWARAVSATPVAFEHKLGNINTPNAPTFINSA